MIPTAQETAGFLNDSTKAVKDIGLSLAGFLDAGVAVAESIKGRVSTIKKTFSNDQLPAAQKSISLPSFFTDNKEQLLVFGAVGIIGVAILYSAIAK